MQPGHGLQCRTSRRLVVLSLNCSTLLGYERSQRSLCQGAQANQFMRLERPAPLFVIWGMLFYPCILHTGRPILLLIFEQNIYGSLPKSGLAAPDPRCRLLARPYKLLSTVPIGTLVESPPFIGFFSPKSMLCISLSAICNAWPV